MLFFLAVHDKPQSVTATSLYLLLSFTQLIVIFAVRNRSYFWRATRPSWPLLTAIVATGIATLAVTYIPATAHLFAFARLSADELGLIAVFLVAYFIALDVLKVSYYKLTSHDRPAARDVRLRT